MSESSVIVEAITWAEMTAKNQTQKLKTEPASLYRQAHNKQALPHGCSLLLIALWPENGTRFGQVCAPHVQGEAAVKLSGSCSPIDRDAHA